MIWAVVVGVAAGGSDDTTVQRIHELEWARADIVQLASQIPGADGATRAEAMVALGRLRSADAVDALVAGRHDPDPEVRVAAARALALTPGATPQIREWLEGLPVPTAPAALARAEHGELVALILGLGFQGGPDELPVVRGYLDRPWPIGAAASRALGRMAIRKVDGVKDLAGPLCERLSAVDPRAVEDAAWALSRVGLERGSPTDLAAVRAALTRGGTYATTRARLVKALWPRLDPRGRDELFLALASDRSRLVRVALLDAVSGEDVSAEVLASWLVDPDPWIRAAAIGALGREGSDVAHDELARWSTESEDPWERAQAVRALGMADPVAAADATLPVAVRAAEVEVLDDPRAWERLALGDPEPAVRSAAVGSLVDADDTPAEVGQRLLAAQDPAVREAAIELVARGPRTSRLSALIAQLRVESDPDVLAAGLQALAEAGGPYPADIDGVLSRVAGRSEVRTRAAASALARAAGRPALPPAPPAPSEREVALPRGGVATVEADVPALASVGRIRRATVSTSVGQFVIALDPDTAPLAVENFARLAEAHFFDGVVFHRVVPGFVVQAGCPRGDGWGGPGYTIPDEVSALDYGVGAVGMARSDRDTGGSQWFVTTSPQPHLVGEYTRFGEVVQGMEVVARIPQGTRIESVTIERIPGDLVPMAASRR